MFAFLKSRRSAPIPASPGPAIAAEPNAPDLIDVKSLIARYSNAEHAARADAYFGDIPDDAKLLRKPFFGITDTQHNMHGVAEVLLRLRLFPGARVLDFGAGTGWLSRVLACLECRPIAVDVSAKALGLGQRAFERAPVAAGLSIAWRPFDGVTLPVETASVDRIVCYDAFHHVADQAATLAEFYRVLVPGGRAVFHEPGPHHSKAPISQFEMRQHAVIENDIVVEEIDTLAQAIGFDPMELAVTTPRSLSVKLADYNRIIGGAAAPDDANAILGAIIEGAGNLRIFSLSKGEEIPDSRFLTGLAGAFEVTITATTLTALQGHARITNTGTAIWRPSDGHVGGVWFGAQERIGPALRDFGRMFLSDQPILPGQTLEITFDLAIAPKRPQRISFDLVANDVAWFEIIGSNPFFIDLA